MTVIDTFTGASATALTSHTPDAGGSWTTHPSFPSSGAFVSNANRARPGSGTDSRAQLYWSGTPSSADYSVTADATILTAAGVSQILGRTSTSADTCYFARVVGAFGTLELGKRVGGTETIFGSVSHGWSTGTTHGLTLSMSGTTIGLWTSGTLRLSATDSAISAAGKVGLAFASLNVASPDTRQVHLDNLTLDAPIATPDEPPPSWSPPPFPAPRRAAAGAYTLRLQPAPVDAGLAQPVVGPAMPVSAPGARRAASGAYRAQQPISPSDAGLLQPIVATACPASAPGATRAARSAYAIAVHSPADFGISFVSPSVSPAWPDRAPGPAWAGATAYWAANNPPPDAGSRPIPASFPDQAPGPRPIVQVPGSPAPPDAGEPPIAGSMPDRAQAAARGFAAYALPQIAPVEIQTSGPVAPAATAVAPGQSRATGLAYSVAVPPPADAGLPQSAVVPSMPSHAPGARRAAVAAYAVLVPAPVDAGLSGIYYDVYEGDGTPIDYTTYVARTHFLTWTSGPLSYPQVYKFGVRTYDGDSMLEELNVDAVVTLRLDGSGIDISSIPTAPTSLAVSQLAGGGLRLAWIYPTPTDGRLPTGFRAYCTAGGVISYASVAATVAWSRGTVHYTADITPLAAGDYTLAVRAYNAAGTEAGTATIAGTVDTTAPDTPDSLTITAEAEEAD